MGTATSWNEFSCLVKFLNKNNHIPLQELVAANDESSANVLGLFVASYGKSDNEAVRTPDGKVIKLPVNIFI